MARRTLQDEIKKREPFRCPEQEVALNIARTHDRLTADFSRLFKEHGISESQYNALRILRGAGEALPCLEVAARMITQLPDITRLVDRLEGSGLAERERIAEDRRVVLVRITKRGLKVLEELDEPVLALHREQLGHLTREELATLNRLLVKARQPARKTAGAGPG